MRRTTAHAITFGVALSLAAAAAVLAHGGEAGKEALAVEPSDVTAGQTVVLVGSGLEPDNDRVLVLAGQDLVVEFGTVRTNAEGMFQKELPIPSHLPSGIYELRAIGDETLTVPLTVTAIAGGPEASPAAEDTAGGPEASPAAEDTAGGPEASPAADAPTETVDATKTVMPRERTPFELGAILAFVGLATILGGLLVWRAERFHGPAGA